MSDIRSGLIFENYQIDKINFQSNNEYVSNDEPVDVKYEISVSIANNEKDPADHRVSIGCIIFKDATENNYPFSIETYITGYFNCADVQPEQVNSIIQLNAVAILLPYLRATISTITALTGNAALNLPLINVQHLMNSLSHQKEVEHITE